MVESKRLLLVHPMADSDSIAPDLSADHGLVARLIAGDESAFSEVYEREKAIVYGFLLRISGSSSTAADLFQNVWLKLARAAPRLQANSHLRGWLLTVARREHVSFRRSQALDISRLVALRRTEQPIEVDANDDTLDKRDLKAALEKLSDIDREVLLATATENLTTDRVAEVLGLQPAAYRKRLSRARTRLNELLDRDCSTSGEPPLTPQESAP